MALLGYNMDGSQTENKLSYKYCKYHYVSNIAHGFHQIISQIHLRLLALDTGCYRDFPFYASRSTSKESIVLFACFWQICFTQCVCRVLLWLASAKCSLNRCFNRRPVSLMYFSPHSEQLILHIASLVLHYPLAPLEQVPAWQVIQPKLYN